jgi:DNA polymerase-1
MDPSPATLPHPADDRAIYVLDVSGYVFRAYHALPPLSTAKGEPSHAVLGFTNMLLKLVNELKPVRLCVALDTRTPSVRKARYPAYKENRTAAPEDLYGQLERCFEILDAYGVARLAKDGIEADDLIATLVKRALPAGYKVVIVSSDKDLLQLIGDGVVMYDTMRERVFGPIETKEKMGVPPEQVRDFLALTGDSSDNIPGVPSVGPKTAQELLRTYRDLDDVYAHVEEITKKALKAKLIAHKDDAYLSRELVTLDEDIAIDLDFEALKWSGGDQERLRTLFRELEFTRLIEQLDPLPPPTHERFEREIVGDKARLAEIAAELAKHGRMSLFTALDDDAPLTGELVGLSLSDGKRVFYVPSAHYYLGAPPQIAEKDVLEVLKPLLEDAKVAKVAASLKRETIALRRRGITLRGYGFDTTIASYLLEAGRHAHDIEDVARAELALDLVTYDRTTEKQRGSQKQLATIDVERVSEYANERAELAWTLAELLAPRLEKEGFTSLFADVELPLTEVLVDLEGTGVRIDAPYLLKMSQEIGGQIRELEAKAYAIVGHEFNLGSPRQLETILFDEMGLPVLKRTRTSRSTDSDVLEELGDSHELPKVILEHRQLSKLKGTYLDALPKQVNRATNRVHTVYNQAVAATGRLSSSDPNLQNIPIRTDVGRRIRTAFIPEEGWSLLSADYSQIELRVLAHLSDDAELIDAFSKDEDVHVRTATALFDVAPDAVTREQRGQAKTVNYAVIYGQSHFALARNLGIDRREAMRYIEAFFARYAGVNNYMEQVIVEARRAGAVRTLLGRRRELPDLRSRNRSLRNAAERIARNTPIQGSAADIMKLAMIAIDREIHAQKLESRMLITVHDELVFETPPGEAEALRALVKREMEHPIELKVPLRVDSGFGKTWGEAH